MSGQNQKFRFFSNGITITKAKDAKGETIMRLGGIASTKDEDADGEFLDPTGFDTSFLQTNGVVNWHHGAKSNPETIIGEPSKVELNDKGLYLEVDLYPQSAMAKGVYKLAQVLEKNSKTRRLGFSIEGRALERGSNDKNHPAYNQIKKAAITGVAITHMPKNPNTLAQIIKGEVDLSEQEEVIEKSIDQLTTELKDELTKAKLNFVDELLKAEEGTTDEEEEDEEGEEKVDKSLTTDSPSGKALQREHVDGMKTVLTKGRVFEQIFSEYPAIDINKARQIYQLIQHIATMSKRQAPSQDDINKAFETFGVSAEGSQEVTLESCLSEGRSMLEKGITIDDLEKELLLKGIPDDMIFQTVEELKKGGDAEEDEDEDEEEEVTKGDDNDEDDADENGDEEQGEEVFMKKGDDSDSYEKYLKKGGEMSKCGDGDYMKKGDSFVKKENTIQKAGDNGEILKAIEAQGLQHRQVAKATGTVLKALMEKNDELEKGMEILTERLGKLEETPAARKSAPTARAVDRVFGEGEKIEKGGEPTISQYSISDKTHRKPILDVLEKAAFAPLESTGKLDAGFAKALEVFEASGQMNGSTAQRLKLERKVVIVA